VAQIRKSFGLKGELKVESFSRTAEELQQLEQVLLGEAVTPRTAPCEIESVKMRGDEIYVKLRGVDDKTACGPAAGTVSVR
jgi:ribosomal 30S subunit maturation factor RimM